MLADREGWLGPNRCDTGVDLGKSVGVRLPQLIERRPLLAILVDILAIILADQAVLRRRLAGGVLGAAGDTDIVLHGFSLLIAAKDQNSVMRNAYCVIAPYALRITQ